MEQVKGDKQFLNRTRCYVLTFFLVSIGLSLFIFLNPQEELSETENRYLSTNDTLKETSFLNGTFQSELENLFSDQFPFRLDLVRVKNSLDHALTGFLGGTEAMSVNPDSLLIQMGREEGHYRLGDTNYMVYYPILENDVIEDRILNRCEEINEFAKAHPELEVYVYRPIQAHETDLFDEVNELTCYGTVYNEELRKLLTVENDYLKIKDLEDYKRMFYASDHHWNNVGSYQGYLDIVKLLGIREEPLKPSCEILLPEDRLFYGTHANATGRVLEGDIFKVYLFDYPDFTILDLSKNPAETVADISNPNVFAATWQTTTADYYYNDAYSTYGAYTLFETEYEDKENLLIIGDSYMAPVCELIASHFHQTYTVRPRDIAFDYEAFLKEHPVDKVLIMYTIENYFYDEVYLRFEMNREGK